MTITDTAVALRSSNNHATFTYPMKHIYRLYASRTSGPIPIAVSQSSNALLDIRDVMIRHTITRRGYSHLFMEVFLVHKERFISNFGIQIQAVFISALYSEENASLCVMQRKGYGGCSANYNA